MQLLKSMWAMKNELLVVWVIQGTIPSSYVWTIIKSLIRILLGSYIGFPIKQPVECQEVFFFSCLQASKPLGQVFHVDWDPTCWWLEKIGCFRCFPIRSEWFSTCFIGFSWLSHGWHHWQHLHHYQRRPSFRKFRADCEPMGVTLTGLLSDGTKINGELGLSL